MQIIYINIITYNNGPGSKVWWCKGKTACFIREKALHVLWLRQQPLWVTGAITGTTFINALIHSFILLPIPDARMSLTKLWILEVVSWSVTVAITLLRNVSWGSGKDSEQTMEDSLRPCLDTTLCQRMQQCREHCRSGTNIP